MEPRRLKTFECWLVRVWVYLIPAIVTIWTLYSEIIYLRTHSFNVLNFSHLGRYVLLYGFWKATIEIDQSGFNAKFVKKSLWIGLAAFAFLFALLLRQVNNPDPTIKTNEFLVFLAIVCFFAGPGLGVVFSRNFLGQIFTSLKQKSESVAA